MISTILLLTISQSGGLQLEELQKHILKSRLSIKSGEVVIVEKKRKRDDPKKAFTESGYTWKIFLSGEKIRGDFVVNKGAGANVRQFAISNGETQGWAFAYEELPDVIAYYRPIEKVPGLLGKEGMLLFAGDFRAIGMSNCEVMDAIVRRFDHLFHRAKLNREKYVITEEFKEGNKVVRFLGSSRPDNAVSIDFSVLPEQGWNLTEFSSKRAEFSWRTTIQNHQINGLWFPKALKYSLFEHGELMCEEDVLIEVKSLNSPINDDVFARKSLGLKSPTFISIPNGYEVFTKGLFVPYSEYKAKAPKAASAGFPF